MRLQEQTTATVADRLGPETIAVLPVGSVEQHGPALPLGTDRLAADGIADTVDRPDAIVLPPIPVGVSAHHEQFHGTLSVDPTTLEAYVTDVLASIATHDVTKAVIVNGHGGNTDALRRCARRLRDEDTLFAVPWNWWDGLEDLIDEHLETSLGHADEVETSVMLALTDLVRESELPSAERDAVDAWGESVAGAPVAFDTIDFAPNGVVGHPTNGTAEIGEALVDAAAADLDRLIDWLADHSAADLRRAPHR
ncbi:MAG: creatininase family protein [Halobacteriaceae archaeon]